MSKSNAMVLNFYLKNFSNIDHANILFGTQKTDLVCKGQFFIIIYWIKNIIYKSFCTVYNEFKINERELHKHAVCVKKCKKV